MKNLKRKVTAIVLSTLFAAMQVSYASIDTGLGAGNGGADINNITGGYQGIDGVGTGNVDLNFDGNAHVNWDHLNINKGESLNFNAVNGANNLTILNTVNHGMSTISGQISANSGIGQLIIANPNGVLFDGCQFTTAGDLMVTTQDMSQMNVNDLSNAKFTQIYDSNGNLIGIDIKNGATFNIGGEYNVLAPSINIANSTIKADSVRLVTANGQDYLALGAKVPTDKPVVRMEAVDIDGDVYIQAGPGKVHTVSGGKINGNLTVNSEDRVALNYNDNGKKLVVTGDVNVTANGEYLFLRDAEVGGNLSMTNGGGFLDVGNLTVTGDAILRTTDLSQGEYRHFVHVIGDTNIGGDLTIDSLHNIHIGGYDYDAKQLADGSLTVGGAIDAYAHNGTIAVTIDTTADTIKLTSENLNIITDGKALLTANDYQFKAKGYIGGLSTTNNSTVDDQVIYVMENYKLLDNPKSHTYLNIAGGTVSNIETEATAYIDSKGNMDLTGANANNIYIGSDKDITILGDGVHANTITVAGKTDNLTVETAANSRDYTLKYTNIRDAKEITIDKSTEITYDMANGENGWNIRDPRPEDTTYLVVKGGGGENPEPNPDPTPIPDGNENAKVLRSYENQSVNMSQVYTPVAYAADLDDDQIDRGVRKNVDGSVTVVRAFPMVN